ncbi:MAG TPA: ferritin-like domain-containing protein [Candidatus Omnitrophota bacterium]|nr:ferritin-like domain-containing protein [Candidatus Omnitrophota bacterium]
MTTLAQAAIEVLTTADPAEKCRLTRQHAEAWFSGAIRERGDTLPPDRPARPERPELLAPKDMPKRAYGGDRGRIALVHALAHIELNAIDLAWDIVCRFPGDDMPKGFIDDWVQVAVDEAEHFEVLERLLNRWGAAYGDLPAHDGLWQAAEKTADDLLARFTVVPMTLEARGLDTTPATMAKLARNGDTETPPALDVIYHDEIKHVAAGVRWFVHMAEKRGLDPLETFHRIHAERFPGGLKPPFNHEARAEAGFPREWYEALAR